MRLGIICAGLVWAAILALPEGTFGQNTKNTRRSMNEKKAANKPEKLEVATLGAGCFWCVEAVFEQLQGVANVESGYAGGAVENPTYQQVCTGQTGHAEVCQVYFDPAVISYPELLEVFFKTHDPTTLNRQGPDIGTQYRSAIFFHNDEQRKIAEQYRAQLNASGVWDRPIVTEIVPFTKFYRAEAYHQDYFRLNPGERYCTLVIQPKVTKFKKEFRDKLQKAR